MYLKQRRNIWQAARLNLDPFTGGDEMDEKFITSDILKRMKELEKLK